MIQIENLNFRYARRGKLFDRLSLSLDNNHIYGLLGCNGAGKTTLLKIMMGILFPKGGTCRVLDHNSCERMPITLADMFFVPEEFYAPEMVIGRYVDLYAAIYPVFSYEQFDAYMDEFQLDKRCHFNSFSLGQKKKAILSFALATNTRILLLDEPTNGLDIPSKAQFRRMVASAATTDRCIIISTHQVRDIDMLMDAIVVLDNGRIALNQTVEAITSKLSFKSIPELTGEELYAESSVAGYQVLTPNTDSDDTQINPELLFNALITNKQAMQKIFNE